jgi:hypothetical protein
VLRHDYESIAAPVMSKLAQTPPKRSGIAESSGRAGKAARVF